MDDEGDRALRLVLTIVKSGCSFLIVANQDEIMRKNLRAKLRGASGRKAWGVSKEVTHSNPVREIKGTSHGPRGIGVPAETGLHYSRNKESAREARERRETRMKNVLRGVIVFTALAGAVAVSAQTADEIVQKHLAAIGGKDAISQVKSISMENSAQIMGTEAPGTILIVDGVGYRSETDFNGQKIINCFTDKGGWMVNPMMGSSDPTPLPDDQYKLGKTQIYVGGPLYEYASKGSKIELLGKDDKTFRIKLTTKDNVDFVYVIDASTYLVKSQASKGKMQDQEVDITTSFSDYRKTDTGYMIPYSLDIDFGGNFQLTIIVKKIELNKPIDPAVFEMPKPAPAPAAAPAAPANKPA